jgi:hypothetical protein
MGPDDTTSPLSATWGRKSLSLQGFWADHGLWVSGVAGCTGGWVLVGVEARENRGFQGFLDSEANRLDVARIFPNLIRRGAGRLPAATFVCTVVGQSQNSFKMVTIAQANREAFLAAHTKRHKIHTDSQRQGECSTLCGWMPPQW